MELEGILTVAGVLAAGLVACGLAIWLARAVGLDRWLLSGGPIDPVEADIERLAAVAELARCEGLIAAEGRVDRAREPVLAVGIGLAIEGIDPERLRTRLDEVIQETARASHARWAGMPWGTLATAGASALLLAVILTNAADPARTSATAAAVALCAFFGTATMVGLARPRNAPTASAGLLSGMMQASAAVMIRLGRDGASVRQELHRMLPATPPKALLKSKAA